MPDAFHFLSIYTKLLNQQKLLTAAVVSDCCRSPITRDADCIYMIEEGCIVEPGTHEGRLYKNGKYAAALIGF